jgi:hypothetical protein
MPEGHVHAKEHQRDTYRKTYLNLKENQILWTWDFSDFHTAISKGEQITICDMIIVREWIVFKDGDVDRSDFEENEIIYEDVIRFRKYIDAVCSDQDTNCNDIYYFINVLEQLYEEGFFDPDKYHYIWFDGGPKHFKNCYTMRWVFEFFSKYSLKGEWNYFESNHGNSSCDSHASKINQAKNSSDIKGHIINDADRLKNLVELKLSNTYCLLFENIDRSDLSVRDAYEMRGIQSMRQFILSPDGPKPTLQGRALSGVGKFTKFY